MKSRLSLHSCSTDNEDVPHKWILNFSTSIQVLHNESIFMTSAVLVDFGMLDILNESSTKIPWKVDYLFSDVVLKLKKCPISGCWISAQRFKSCTMKASVWHQLGRRDFGILDILNESSTKIPWKVDYLFTAVVLKLKNCPISGYWIWTHRFKSCTMKAFVWLQLVDRDYGILTILNERSTKISLKVDYLFTEVLLKLKMCPNSGYRISVQRFQSCKFKASVRLQLGRRDFGMLDILNESSTKIPWKVDYLFTAVVLTMKMCLISGYWISAHRFKSCTMKASLWLQLFSLTSVCWIYWMKVVLQSLEK